MSEEERAPSVKIVNEVKEDHFEAKVEALLEKGFEIKECTINENKKGEPFYRAILVDVIE